MPELPELEALARTITGPIAGAPISAVPRAHFAVLKTALPPLATLDGRTIERTERRGKHLLFHAGELTLAVHLMTMGRIGYYPPGVSKRPKAPILDVRFGDGGALLGTEGGTRKSMRVGVYDAGGLTGLIGHLGPEPLTDAFDRTALDGICDAEGRQLNTLLRDGRRLAGIGRAFADEILHEAMLSPFAISTRLPAAGRDRLHTAIRTVLARGVEECLARQGPVLPARNDGRLLRIHGHDGEPCPRCTDTLRFVDFESNRIVYCARCQTDGRILADRRLSRLLK
jgi:formamidopyrimidine-DNA glycosylase